MDTTLFMPTDIPSCYSCILTWKKDDAQSFPTVILKKIIQNISKMSVLFNSSLLRRRFEMPARADYGGVQIRMKSEAGRSLSGLFEIAPLNGGSDCFELDFLEREAISESAMKFDIRLHLAGLSLPNTALFSIG